MPKNLVRADAIELASLWTCNRYDVDDDLFGMGLIVRSGVNARYRHWFVLLPDGDGLTENADEDSRQSRLNPQIAHVASGGSSGHLISTPRDLTDTLLSVV